MFPNGERPKTLKRKRKEPLGPQKKIKSNPQEEKKEPPKPLSPQAFSPQSLSPQQESALKDLVDLSSGISFFKNKATINLERKIIYSF